MDQLWHRFERQCVHLQHFVSSSRLGSCHLGYLVQPETKRVSKRHQGTSKVKQQERTGDGTHSRLHSSSSRFDVGLESRGLILGCHVN